jgi:hypothetical protein
MKKISENTITIIAEFTVLILSCLWYYKTHEIEPIIGIIGSAAFFLISLISFLIPNKEKNIEHKIGVRESKYLDKYFLYNYIPSKVSINKIIEDFGQPILKTGEIIEQEWNDDKDFEISIYKYKFTNAVVLISTEINQDTVISISLISGFDKKYPVNCRYSFTEDDKIFGEATFSQNILDNLQKFKSDLFVQWSYSSIVSRYGDYRTIKYLYFTYWNYNHFDNPKELLNKKIEDICITTTSMVTPIIPFDDYLFN